MMTPTILQPRTISAQDYSYSVTRQRNFLSGYPEYECRTTFLFLIRFHTVQINSMRRAMEYSSSHAAQPRRIICILNALAEQPRTFQAFLSHLAPEDLPYAWELAADLAERPNLGQSSDCLAAWCTKQLLKKY